jgi:hypothetical protein
LKGTDELVRAPVGDPWNQLRLAPPSLRLHELEEEELVERQAPAAHVSFAHALRPVQKAQGIREPRQAEVPQVAGVEVFVLVRPLEKRRKVPLEDPAQHPLRHLFTRRIRDEDRPGALRLLPTPGQHRVFPGLQLPAVEEPDRAGDQQHVTLSKLAVEPRLAGPRHRDHPRLVLEHRLEDA